MAVITFKCSDQEKEAFETYCENKGVSVSEMLRTLINQASGNTPKKISIVDIDERLRALESKFERMDSQRGLPAKETSLSNTKKRKEPAPVDPNAELITIDQASTLTGYSTSTLSSKFSREGIQTVKRIDGNRGGLYSKNEILDKIGRK